MAHMRQSHATYIHPIYIHSGCHIKGIQLTEIHPKHAYMASINHLSRRPPPPETQ